MSVQLKMPSSLNYTPNSYKGKGQAAYKDQKAALWNSSKYLSGMTGLADTTASTVNPMLEGYMGEGLGDWKRGQIAQRSGATTANFNNALAQNRLRARMSGFGYEQPAEQMGETNIENARAAELSQIAPQVEDEAFDKSMQAANLRLGSGQQQAGAYGTAAVGQLGIADANNPQGWYELEEADKARKAALWSSIIGAGASIATGGLSSLGGKVK